MQPSNRPERRGEGERDEVTFSDNCTSNLAASVILLHSGKLVADRQAYLSTPYISSAQKRSFNGAWRDLLKVLLEFVRT